MEPVITMRPPRELMAKPDSSRTAVILSSDQESTDSRSRKPVMTLTERPRQTRSRAPRARTGCKPCKRRHIKCDEGKPSCQRCLIGGRVCEGLAYGGVAASLPKPKTGHDKTIDRTMLADKFWQLLSTAVPAAVSDNLFHSAKEWDHFQFFLRMCIPDDTLPEGCLQLLTPKVAHMVPAVKEICCAVGALSKTMSTSGKEATDALTDSSDHYSRAAALLRSCVPTNDTLLSVCVASLMFTTYEMMCGQPHVAFSHYKHAFLIFEQYLANRSEEAGVPLAELKLTELERAMSDTVQRMSTYPWSNEIDLVETPSRNSNGMSCCNGQLYTSLLFRMPTSFDSMTTSAKWWDATQHFVMHHVQQGRTGGATERRMWEQCASALHNWHASFYRLFELSKREFYRDKKANAERYLHGLMLETLYLESMASISRYHGDDANILPATKPLFLEMVRVTGFRIPFFGPFDDNANPAEKFLLRPLAYVLMRCDAPEVVDEIRDVMKLLKKPGAIGKALLGLLGSDLGEKPLTSSLGGWIWDFVTSGCASVSLKTEKEGRSDQNWKNPHKA